jgi:hypothetical protein
VDVAEFESWKCEAYLRWMWDWSSLDFSEKCIKYFNDKFLGLSYLVELEALEGDENQITDDEFIFI